MQVVSMINDKFVVPLVLYPWHFYITRNHSLSYTLHVWLLLEVVASISVIVHQLLTWYCLYMIALNR